MTSSPVARRAVSLRTGRPTKDKVRALLAAGTVLGLGAIGTTAAWTDQGTATTGTFTLGTIDLKLNGNDNTALTTLAATAMKPGDTVQAAVIVSNAATVPFTYNLAGTSTTTSGGADSVGAAMKLVIQLGACASNVSATLNTPQTFATTLTANRSLAAGASETLCFTVTLPTDAATGLQGRNSTASFLFTATSS